MKTHINLTIDTDLYLEAKLQKVSLSAEFNKYLKSYLAIKEKKVSDASIDKELAKMRVQTLKLEEKKRKRDEAAAKEAKKWKPVRTFS